MLAEPAGKIRLAELGAILLPGSPTDFGKLLAEKADKWGRGVKFSGDEGGLGAADFSRRCSLNVRDGSSG